MKLPRTNPAKFPTVVALKGVAPLKVSPPSDVGVAKSDPLTLNEPAVDPERVISKALALENEPAIRPQIRISFSFMGGGGLLGRITVGDRILLSRWYARFLP